LHANGGPGSTGLDGWLDETLTGTPPWTPDALQELVTTVGRSPWLWGEAIRFDLARRSYRVLLETPGLEVALFGWAAGQETVYHDHGGASGAVFVCSGLLVESTVEALDAGGVRERTYSRCAESSFSFGPDYIHRVRHEPALGVALSIHAYAPAFGQQTDYELLDNGTLRPISATSQCQAA
jgi:predicted metal-dependent enzyme (double-stranded beta helix superfamily)